MLDVVRIAAAGLESKPGQTAQNLAKIDAQAADAVIAGAQLVLFPELSLTGFLPNHPVGDHDAWLRAALATAREMAEPIPGPAIDDLIAIAQTRKILISTGLLEDAGHLLFNTQVVVSPQGLLGKWRKLHVPMFEMPFYNGGDVVPVIETPLGRLGVNICFDALMPESTRLLAVENVEIVLFPFAADPPPRTPQGWANWAGPSLQARCRENGVFGIAANYVGEVECAGAKQNFPGGGMALGPDGEIIADWPAESNSPTMLVVDFTAESLREARAAPEYLFRFRRPELYGPLAQ
jgi:predicted amidohydrolase